MLHHSAAHFSVLLGVHILTAKHVCSMFVAMTGEVWVPCKLEWDGASPVLPAVSQSATHDFFVRCFIVGIATSTALQAATSSCFTQYLGPCPLQSH